MQIHPEYDDKYRILDGAHRWHAYKEIGATEIPVHIITLDGLDPLLYAAKMPSLAIPLNADLLKGFTFPQVAEKHGWTEPMVWSIALECKNEWKSFDQSFPAS